MIILIAIILLIALMHKYFDPIIDEVEGGYMLYYYNWKRERKEKFIKV